MIRLALFAAASAGLLAAPAAAATKDWSAVPMRPLEIGGTVAGSLDPADLDDKDLWRDWYAVSAEAGETLTFSIEGGGEEPQLWLYRAQGRDEPVSLQGAMQASGWKRRFSYPVRQSGQYILSVASRYMPGGAYRVVTSSDKRSALASAGQPPKATPVPTAGSAQRIEVDPARKTSYEAPIGVRQGDTIASEISESDSSPMPLFREEHFLFTGHAGETITAGVTTGIPLLFVIFQDERRREIARGSPATGPVKVVLPRDGTYHMVVTSGGSRRYGKYELSFLSSATPPAPAQVAEAPNPTPVEQAQRVDTAPAPPAGLPKLTPPPGVLAAEIGETLDRPAGQPGTAVDVYAFIGEAGSVLQAEAAGSGRYGVTLYTPEGVEMLTATGAAAAKLTAVLPKDAVYLFAVARQDAAQPYRLSLAAEAPDLHLWGFREWAGYEVFPAGGPAYYTCWVTPGSVLRYVSVDGAAWTLTLSRGGAGRWDYQVGGKPAGYSFTTRIEGDKVVRTRAGGPVQTWSFDDPPAKHGAYRGYLCK